MSKVEKWKTSGWDRSKKFADKAKKIIAKIFA
jgi:hypothetical protein